MVPWQLPSGAPQLQSAQSRSSTKSGDPGGDPRFAGALGLALDVDAGVAEGRGAQWAALSVALAGRTLGRVLAQAHVRGPARRGDLLPEDRLAASATAQRRPTGDERFVVGEVRDANLRLEVPLVGIELDRDAVVAGLGQRGRSARQTGRFGAGALAVRGVACRSRKPSQTSEGATSGHGGAGSVPSYTSTGPLHPVGTEHCSSASQVSETPSVPVSVAVSEAPEEVSAVSEVESLPEVGVPPSSEPLVPSSDAPEVAELVGPGPSVAPSPSVGSAPSVSPDAGLGWKHPAEAAEVPSRSKATRRRGAAANDFEVVAPGETEPVRIRSPRTNFERSRARDGEGDPSRVG